MIEVRNLTAQTLQPGQALTFDGTIIRSRCGAECFNSQVPTSVKLRINCAAYDISFSGNITSDTAGAAVQLALAIEGSPLVETAMNATIATANELVNVGTGTFFRTSCGDLSRISVVNTGTVPVTVAPNANLRIRRIA